MSLVLEAKRTLESLPPGFRTRVEGLASWVPRPVLYGSRFRSVRAWIARSERLPAEDLRAWQEVQLRDLVAYAYERVPFYRRVMRERGLEPRHLQGLSDLRHLPLVTKELLRREGDSLLAEGVPEAARDTVTTGGSSGVPLRLYAERERSSVEWAFMTWQWQSAGFRLGDRRAVLRGAVLAGADAGRLTEWHPLLDELVMSTFHLSAQNLPAYHAALRRFRPPFLHAYPSSAEAWARLHAEREDGEAQRFRALLLGSENLYPSQREWLAQAYGCRVYSWYGHSEKCLLGGGCEHSDDYHLFPQYGILELVDDAGEPAAAGAPGTLVGTSFINRVMPLIRYATDDRGEPAEGPCPCGRAYPRLRAIEGRWTGEQLYGRDDTRFSMTALNSHADVFLRIRRFQIRQEEPGEATVLVVPSAEFRHEDRQRVADEYSGRTGGQIRFEVVLVTDLPLTGRGKFLFVDQRIGRPSSENPERAGQAAAHESSPPA